jgi:hypothetical protein
MFQRYLFYMKNIESPNVKSFQVEFHNLAYWILAKILNTDEPYCVKIREINNLLEVEQAWSFYTQKRICKFTMQWTEKKHQIIFYLLPRIEWN